MYVCLAFLSYFTPSFKFPMALAYPDYTSREDLFLLQNPIVGIYNTSLQLHFSCLGILLPDHLKLFKLCI